MKQMKDRSETFKRMSLRKRSSSQFNKLNDKTVNEAKSLVDILQCGICYSAITLDKVPLQCSSCTNTVICGSCSGKLHGKCAICRKPGANYIPISIHLRKLFESIRYKCSLYEHGCKAILKGQNYDIEKHSSNDCEFQHLNPNPEPIYNARTLCMLCSNFYPLPKDHMCDITNKYKFCDNHNLEKHLFSENRILFKNHATNYEENKISQNEDIVIDISDADLDDGDDDEAHNKPRTIIEYKSSKFDLEKN